MENLNEGKKKSPSYMAELAEIDKQSAIVAMEAKINHLQEMTDKKKDKLKMVSEDENLSDLIDPKRKKMMEREIKEIEKAKMKLEKLYEKMSGDKKKEVVGEEEKVDETYGPTNYEEDDSKIDEGGYDSTYEEDDSIKEETNEEVDRFRKLAGLPIFEQKENLNEMFDYAALEKDYMWFSDKNLGNNKEKARKLSDDLNGLRLNGYDEPFNVEKYKEYVKKKLGSNQEKYNSWLLTLKRK